MAVEGRHACMKYFLFIFNILFWILGLVILGLGIYSEIEKRGDVASVVDDNEEAYGGLMIGVGALVAIIGFAGCCGAHRENRQCLIFYGSMVTIIFIIEVVAAGLAYRYRHELDSTVQDGMKRTLQKYTGGSSDVTKSWNFVQSHLKCCGVNNYTDWRNTTFEIDNPGDLPSSCCRSNTNCTFSQPQNIYSQGCYDKVLSDLRKDWQILAGVGIGVAVIQIFGIIFSCSLQAQLKKNEYTHV